MPKQKEITVYGLIGDYFFEEGFTPAQLLRDLKADSDFDEILLRINSPGGRGFDAIAIYNLLIKRPERVIVEIEGLAASAASIIAMAGDEIHISENALMMIHDAVIPTFGNEADHVKTADVLNKLDAQIAVTYAKRSGMKPEDVRTAMDEETWYTADEAVAAGLADKVSPAKEVDAHFDLSMFHNVPPAAERFAKRDGQLLAAFCGAPSADELTHLFSQEPPTMAKETTPATPPAATPPTQTIQSPLAVEVGQIDTAAIEAKAKLEGEKAAEERITKIYAMCNQAGKPDLAQGYVSNGLSVADVQNRLFDAMCKDRPAVGEEQGAPATPANKPKDPDAEFKKEFAANPHLADSLSEDQYVAQRRKEEKGNNNAPVPKAVLKALGAA